MNQVMYKKEFEYEGRYVLIIAVTNYIKLNTKNKNSLYPRVELRNHLDSINKLLPNSK